MDRPVTNLRGLPELWVRAVARDSYSKGDADFSATGLQTAPRRAQLLRRHPVVEDASDLTWNTYGQLMHLLIERAASKLDPREAVLQVREIIAGNGRPTDKLRRISQLLADAEAGDLVIERRFYGTFDNVIVSGQVDLLLDTPGARVVDIADWKNTKAETWCWGGRSDWEAQANIYALLTELNGWNVRDLFIYALFRNWEEKFVGMTKRGWVNAYPDRPVMQIPIPRWPREQTEAYIIERVRLHQEAAALNDNELPPCTESETWRGRRCVKHCRANAHCDVGLVALEKAERRRQYIPTDTAFVGSSQQVA